jgi:heterodisulfide reductase subunit C
MSSQTSLTEVLNCGTTISVNTNADAAATIYQPHLLLDDDRRGSDDADATAEPLWRATEMAADADDE